MLGRRYVGPGNTPRARPKTPALFHTPLPLPIGLDTRSLTWTRWQDVPAPSTSQSCFHPSGASQSERGFLQSQHCQSPDCPRFAFARLAVLANRSSLTSSSYFSSLLLLPRLLLLLLLHLPLQPRIVHPVRQHCKPIALINSYSLYCSSLPSRAGVSDQSLRARCQDPPPFRASKQLLVLAGRAETALPNGHRTVATGAVCPRAQPPV
ncbi:unnamed protein product [Protopolystoma xenopodis]|uniref:Uncharacterized protein n=1 Tax=Protopolystoma xenopodis TaxID=117903 RepID=A0A448WHK3_9PLAT|nr:unnamed protein product [Protopolystoma xenopodis]